MAIFAGRPLADGLAPTTWIEMTFFDLCEGGMMKIGVVAAALAALVVAGCASGQSREAGTFLDPLCAPDGSVVYTQYANSKGSFDGVKASHENCPWYKK